MPTSSSIPKLRRHVRGYGTVRLNGDDHSFGEWPATAKRPLRPDATSDAGPTVNELIVAFLARAGGYHRHPDGTPTGGYDNVRLSLRPHQKLFGDIPAAEFGPLKLRAVRQSLIDAGLARTVINRRVGRIRHATKWAVTRTKVYDLKEVGNDFFEDEGIA